MAWKQLLQSSYTLRSPAARMTSSPSLDSCWLPATGASRKRPPLVVMDCTEQHVRGGANRTHCTEQHVRGGANRTHCTEQHVRGGANRTHCTDQHVRGGANRTHTGNTGEINSTEEDLSNIF